MKIRTATTHTSAWPFCFSEVTSRTKRCGWPTASRLEGVGHLRLLASRTFAVAKLGRVEEARCFDSLAPTDLEPLGGLKASPRSAEEVHHRRLICSIAPPRLCRREPPMIYGSARVSTSYRFQRIHIFLDL